MKHQRRLLIWSLAGLGILLWGFNKPQVSTFDLKRPIKPLLQQNSVPQSSGHAQKASARSAPTVQPYQEFAVAASNNIYGFNRLSNREAAGLSQYYRRLLSLTPNGDRSRVQITTAGVASGPKEKPARPKMILDSEELEFLNSPISALLGLRNGTSGVYLEEPGNPFSKADHKGEEKGTEADHAQTPVNPPTDTESHDRDPRRLSDGPVVRFFGSFEDENAARFVEARPLGQERFGIPQMGIGIFSLAVQPGFLASRFTTTLGDLNNDGLNDLVIADRVSNFITVFLGLGNNTYQEVRRFQSGFGVMALATGDFNGDNHLDLAVATKGGNNISILLGDGFGGFRYVSSFKSVAHPDGIIVADLDGDGTLDLAVLDLGLREIQAFVGNGTGHFAKAAGLEAGIEANSIPTQDWLPGDRIRSIEFVRWGRSVSLSVTYVGGIIESIANFDAGLHQFIGLGNFLDTGKVDLAVGTFVGLIHQ